MNRVEGVLAAVLIVTVVAATPDTSWGRSGLIVALVFALVIGAGLLRPRMDARVQCGQTAHAQPRHALHIG